MGEIPSVAHYVSPPEHVLFQQGYRHIAGIDEAGRGPLAGPVVAASVILPMKHSFAGTLDSKKLRPSAREELFQAICGESLAFGIGIVDQWEIDRINIHRASLKAMEIAVSQLPQAVDYLLVDGIHPIRSSIPQRTVKHGDALSLVIGAASVLAKVMRDRIMEKYHELYPVYNFSKNKGYGTEEHREALKKYGYCALHRKTFVGVVPHKALFDFWIGPS